ncbi:hypothetical protein [Paenibacillus hubeiensis]|uniref:hypothetical protein n=1 Tax=Paenibacillus hubeiensis TaxID=3077330 RepID=UPI0031BA6DC8
MMRIVYGGGSNWGNKKKSKTGETVSRSREVADNAAGSGSTGKSAKNASQSESKNTSRIPSSKTSETDTTTTPKNSTTSKNKNNQDEAPNEMNSWKPKASKKKDGGRSYRIPALNRALEEIPGEYKNISKPKTVYDPKIISNVLMII